MGCKQPKPLKGIMANSKDITYAQIPDSIISALKEQHFDNQQDKGKVLFSLASVANDLTNFRSQLIEKRLEILEESKTQSVGSGMINLATTGSISQANSDYNKTHDKLQKYVSETIEGIGITTSTKGIIYAIVNALDSDASKTANARFEAQQAPKVSLSTSDASSYRVAPTAVLNIQDQQQR